MLWCTHESYLLKECEAEWISHVAPSSLLTILFMIHKKSHKFTLLPYNYSSPTFQSYLLTFFIISSSKIFSTQGLQAYISILSAPACSGPSRKIQLLKRHLSLPLQSLNNLLQSTRRSFPSTSFMINIVWYTLFKITLPVNTKKRFETFRFQTYRSPYKDEMKGGTKFWTIYFYNCIQIQ